MVNGMETQGLCVYNITRKAHLGREAMALDPTVVPLRRIVEHLMFDLAPGIWISPFRGIPPLPNLPPFDLICLDADDRVVEVSAGFSASTLVTNSSRKPPSSALALPLGSIAPTGTAVGDRMLICDPDEFEVQLERRAGPPIFVSSAQPYALPTAAPTNGTDHSTVRETLGVRLLRWLGTDRRKGARYVFSNLVAYTWNGEVPEPLPIGDISESGLYLVTQERWFLGTRMLMTLQKANADNAAQHESIAVQTKVVRWGADGEGLSFILSDSPEHLGDENWPEAVANKRKLKKFLHHMKSEEGSSLQLR